MQSIRSHVSWAALGAPSATGLAVVLSSLSAFSQASTQRISVATAGTECHGASSGAALSGDGHLVVFQSSAADLVAGDTNGVADVFIHDCTAHTTSRLSVALGGGDAHGASREPAISADGRFVAFASLAADLVPGDTNGFEDIFVADLMGGTIEMVSLGAGSSHANGASHAPAVSADGRFVAFTSSATNLVASDTNSNDDIFVRDRQSRTTVRASLGNLGLQGNAPAAHASISGDGRFVAFESQATNFYANDTNGNADVFVRDLVAGTTVLASQSSSGLAGNLGSHAPSISADGSRVVFWSLSTTLVLGDVNGVEDVFVRDLVHGTTTIASRSSSGAASNGASTVCAISADGRVVAFESAATNLVTGDANGHIDVFLRGIDTGATERISVSTGGVESDLDAHAAALSGDARFTTFESAGTTLVAGDANAATDVFQRDRGAPIAVGFCAGDGSATTCPCSNTGALGHGCENSASTGGGLLEAHGVASVAADSVTLVASGLPASTNLLFYQGTTEINGGAGVLFGDGLRCVTGNTQRLGGRFTQEGAAALGADATGTPKISNAGHVPATGGTFLYQGWYRNAQSFCTSATFNLTNGIQILWTP